MDVLDIMTPNVIVISADATIIEAAKIMKTRDIGFLPVVSHERLVGTLTDRDIVIRAIAEDKEPEVSLVRDAMSKNVVSCFEDQDVEEAAAMMEKAKIHRLVVFNHSHKIVGLVSLGDISRESSDERLAGEIHREIVTDLHKSVQDLH